MRISRHKAAQADSVRSDATVATDGQFGPTDDISPAPTSRKGRKAATKAKARAEAQAAVAREVAAKQAKAHTRGKGRPLRALFGLAAALLGSASMIAGLAPTEKRYGLPPVTESAQIGLAAYGALLFVVAIWAVFTSGPRKVAVTESATKSAAQDLLVEQPVEARRPELPEVLTPLRNEGWFVGQDVELPNADADYVLVGPAGVLCVQVMVTNVRDPRGKSSVRARIAAQQLQRILSNKEVHLDVVPAVLAWGPGQDDAPGGVKVVDNVAYLFGDQVGQWLPALVGKTHIPPHVQEHVAGIVADILEGIEPAIAGERVPASA